MESLIAAVDAGPLAFVDDIDRPQLDAGDRHHLQRVLRLRPGDPCATSDGRGRWRPCRLTSEGVDPAGEVVIIEPPSPPLAVAFALVKSSKPELIVQKLTELGIDAIRPFTAARSVVRWDRASRVANHQRLVRVSREAAMQCRRVHLPHVAPIGDFSEVASLPGAAQSDVGGGPPTLATPLILVGPEGGWSPDERAVDLPYVALAPHVLRAETAAIAAGAVLAGLRMGTIRTA